MYGTVATFRVKAGMDARLLELTRDEVQGAPIPGFVALYLSRLDADPQSYSMTVIFASKDAYAGHANSPASNARFKQIMELLEAAPTWQDGDIVLAHPLPASVSDPR